MKRIF